MASSRHQLIDTLSKLHLSEDLSLWALHNGTWAHITSRSVIYILGCCLKTGVIQNGSFRPGLPCARRRLSGRRDSNVFIFKFKKNVFIKGGVFWFCYVLIIKINFFSTLPLRHRIKTSQRKANMVGSFIAVLRIRDVYPGSRIRLFSIPEPGSLIRIFPSRI